MTIKINGYDLVTGPSLVPSKPVGAHHHSRDLALHLSHGGRSHWIRPGQAEFITVLAPVAYYLSGSNLVLLIVIHDHAEEPIWLMFVVHNRLVTVSKKSSQAYVEPGHGKRHERDTSDLLGVLIDSFNKDPKYLRFKGTVPQHSERSIKDAWLRSHKDVSSAMALLSGPKWTAQAAIRIPRQLYLDLDAAVCPFQEDSQLSPWMLTCEPATQIQSVVLVLGKRPVSRMHWRHVVLLSATLPYDVLEMTTEFMTKPIRILVKRDELML
ncbi:hypothetical protein DFH07DRAFT_770788 [Mycena maculata]|uniref:Uncharacterized protein n=1 Tax=Mycena maculata TaxID=230809 RepID=A0AAD7JFH5_9AGAR|nr:hypothetical protein DFH07DRAFT_770788 [Mycena maculata]